MSIFEPMPAGRPTKYDPAYCDQVEKLCKLGATDEEIADFFEVAVTTIDNWKNDYPEFLGAIKRGKTIADMNVANKLYDRATGAVIKVEQAFKLKEITYENGKKNGETERIEIVQLEQEQPPDTTAAIFWLKNRQPKKWRDKQETGFTNKDGEDINPVQIIQLPSNGREST